MINSKRSSSWGSPAQRVGESLWWWRPDCSPSWRRTDGWWLRHRWSLRWWRRARGVWQEVWQWRCKLVNQAVNCRRFQKLLDNLHPYVARPTNWRGHRQVMGTKKHSSFNVYLLVNMKLKTEKSNQANVGLLLNINSLLIIGVHFGPDIDDILQY